MFITFIIQTDIPLKFKHRTFFTLNNYNHTKMKKIIAPIITGLILGVLGFYIGNTLGYENGKQYAEELQKTRDIEEIKIELKMREGEIIEDLLDGTASIKTIDEGSLFQIKYVQYFSGALTNNASIATAKDIKLNVDYYSKTDTKIGNQEVTIFEYIKPDQTVNFKVKVSVPDNVDNFKFQIIEAAFE